MLGAWGLPVSGLGGNSKGRHLYLYDTTTTAAAAIAAAAAAIVDGDLGKERGLTKVEHVLLTFSLSERAGGNHGGIYNTPRGPLTPWLPLLPLRRPSTREGRAGEGRGHPTIRPNQNKNI